MIFNSAMDNLTQKLRDFRTGTISEADMLEFLSHFPFSRDREIKLDFHRRLRRGVPEAIYGRSKSLDQLRKIIGKFMEMGEEILVTKIEPDVYATLSKDFQKLRYHFPARIITFDHDPILVQKGSLLVVSGGASDEAVAEEAFVSSAYLGNPTQREYDVGVACLPRILDLQGKMDEHSAVIAVAGMEGALPSVVAGLTATPVIAVPTSIGYGANFSGISALLAMLNSCSGGVSVVNIDNGFGAAYQATLINRKRQS